MAKRSGGSRDWGKQKGFHLRCCKCSLSSSQGVPPLNISKKIKLRFWYFYHLCIKIKSITMLPPSIYKFFYLSAMVANIFELLMVHFFETPDLPLIFVKLRYFWRFTYSFVFSCEINKIYWTISYSKNSVI